MPAPWEFSAPDWFCDPNVRLTFVLLCANATPKPVAVMTARAILVSFMMQFLSVG